MSEPTAIFCCGSSIILPIASYRSRKECELWWFSCRMSDIIPTPAATYEASPIPERFLAAALNESPFVIQFEKWIEGEERDRRCYIPHPAREYGYLELEREVVKKGGWVWGWSYIKLRCQHEGTFFVVKYLERVNRAKEGRYIRYPGRAETVADSERAWAEEWDLQEEPTFRRMATDEENFQLQMDGEGK